MTSRDDVIAAARGYLGVRWHHQGRSRAGIDCAGLIIAVANDLGLSAFDTADYGHIPSAQRMQQHLNDQAVRIYDLRPGCILLMKFEAEPQHLAIYAGRTMIHALMQARAVVEHNYGEPWPSRTVAYYDFPGLSD